MGRSIALLTVLDGVATIPVDAAVKDDSTAEEAKATSSANGSSAAAHSRSGNSFRFSHSCKKTMLKLSLSCLIWMACSLLDNCKDERPEAMDAWQFIRKGDACL